MARTKCCLAATSLNCPWIGVCSKSLRLGCRRKSSTSSCHRMLDGYLISLRRQRQERDTPLLRMWVWFRLLLNYEQLFPYQITEEVSDYTAKSAPDSSTLGIRTRKYRAVIHKSAAVSHITNETPSEKGFPGFGLADGTMPTVWFTAECISMVSSRLPRVWA